MKKTQNAPEPKFGKSDYEDLALLAGIKRNHQPSYERMYKKYVPILTRRFFRNFKSHEELKDVVIEIMAKIFENIEKYERNYTFNSWLSALARNYVTDYFRAKKKNVSDLNSFSMDGVLLNQTGELIQFDIPCSEPEAMTPKPEVERQAKLEYIYDVIDNLPDNELKKFPEEAQDLFMFYQDLQVIHSRTDNTERIIEIMSGHTGLPYQEVKKQVDAVKRKYEQAEIDREVLKMYLRENRPYKYICDKFNWKMPKLKVRIWRLTTKLEQIIDARKVVMTVSSKYTIDKLRGDGFIQEQEINQGEVRVR